MHFLVLVVQYLLRTIGIQVEYPLARSLHRGLISRDSGPWICLVFAGRTIAWIRKPESLWNGTNRYPGQFTSPDIACRDLGPPFPGSSATRTCIEHTEPFASYRRPIDAR